MENNVSLVNSSMDGFDHIRWLLCNTNTALCLPQGWEIATTCVMAFSALVNVIHMVILRTLTGIRGTPYYTALQHITVSDLVHSVVFLSNNICSVRMAIGESRIGICIFCWLTALALAKHLVTAGATAERAVAMSKPLAYKELFVIRHYNALMWTLWFVPSALFGVLVIIYADVVCLNALIGPVLFNMASRWYWGFYTAAPNIVLIINLAVIMRHLRKLRTTIPPSAMTLEMKASMNAAYVMTSISALYLCLCVAPIFGVALHSTVLQGTMHILPVMLMVISNAFYGISNVVAVFVVSKAYREKFVKLFKCNTDHNTVHSID